MAGIYDERICELGEGVLWHPERGQYFWFDILGRRLLSRHMGEAQEWPFDRMASAAGWVDADHLMIAHEHGLGLLNLTSGELKPVAAIEAEKPETRSNDGRADRQGGFWFGTMGKQAERGAGAIYRYYRGEIRRVVDRITIPNAICFSPAGETAYFADTKERKIWTQPLDPQGWPRDERRLFLDCGPLGLSPDGAVTDCEGALWVACWGAGAVIRFGPDGRQKDRLGVGGRHSSCPAFGGADLDEMLVTTACEGIDHPDAAQGVTYLVRPAVKGLPEPQVVL